MDEENYDDDDGSSCHTSEFDGKHDGADVFDNEDVQGEVDGSEDVDDESEGIVEDDMPEGVENVKRKTLISRDYGY
uniref:Uncharacterized protein n=1 Tax=Psilocybe cubensis TaxID=181762 RepID=A0A8H8CNN5_PSICU